jgi:adenosine 3'-phospho 5'-phosphosulfate transporter B2
MAWGLLLGGRRYNAIDYICACTVTIGCALFVLTGSIAAPQQLHAAAAAATAALQQQAAGQDAGPWAAAAHAAKGEASSSWMLYGLLLLGAFLLFDGLTSTTQDRLFAQHEMHSCNQLLWVSAWSAAVRCVRCYWLA